ncbi:hypothetical protein PSTG_09186 [Puccinia striiformis f. sp. tritici PST-78]|uniref:Myb/SANT-like domain-containing protein n=1 Tax=Puccinia striiformis f. sp. tritici PST-78 TaxID=1165861 RepID=A0A0L0VE04_9BASI|nr:hypothetical protein PSTG_09186 [Puccinia striiformis f. sp. tritici PST-78]
MAKAKQVKQAASSQNQQSPNLLGPLVHKTLKKQSRSRGAPPNHKPVQWSQSLPLNHQTTISQQTLLNPRPPPNQQTILNSPPTLNQQTILNSPPTLNQTRPLEKRIKPKEESGFTHLDTCHEKKFKASKRGEGGFKPKVHPHVASELLKEFRGNLFDSTKVKSKYTQGFKKTYNAFVACKGASGFSWNKANCMVVAPDNVWDEFLLHPCARQFRNTPFPEYNEYQIIFEGHTAKGDMCQSSGTKPHEACQALGTATSREDGTAIDDESESRQTPAQ